MVLAVAYCEWCEDTWQETVEYSEYRWRQFSAAALRGEWEVMCNKPCVIFVSRRSCVERRATDPLQCWDNVLRMNGSIDDRALLAQDVVVGLGSLSGPTTGTIRLKALFPNGTSCSAAGAANAEPADWWPYAMWIGIGVELLIVVCMVGFCCYVYLSAMSCEKPRDDSGERRSNDDDFGDAAVVSRDVEAV